MDLRHDNKAVGSAPATTLWVALIAALSVAGSLAFTCAAPFAAIAALAALTMRRMEGAAMVVVAWLANQIVGFGLLNYPLEASTFGWGAAMGVAAVLGYAAARALARLGMSTLVSLAVTFVAAFAAYEVALYGYGLAVGDGGESFTAEIVGQILVINAVAFAGLLVLHRAAVALTLLRPSAEPAAI